MARGLGRRNRLDNETTQTGNTGQALREHLDFVSDRVFTPPAIGIYRGKFVKVQERGNTKGMSATWWITDELGQSKIVSLHDVTLMDVNYIAPTTSQMDQLLNGVQFDQQP